MNRTTYSPKLREALDALKPAFREIGSGLQQLTQKRAEIAPAFMQTYTLWKRETRRPFVAFVHELDARCPVDRKGYKKHPTYQAALYLQQLERRPTAKQRQGVTPLALLAVTIKSFLPLLNTSDQRTALVALLAASKWRQRDQSRLLAAIGEARPVALPKVPRLVAAATKAVLVAVEREHVA